MGDMEDAGIWEQNSAKIAEIVVPRYWRFPNRNEARGLRKEDADGGMGEKGVV